jgi:hypothetical protein
VVVGFAVDWEVTAVVETASAVVEGLEVDCMEVSASVAASVTASVSASVSAIAVAASTGVMVNFSFCMEAILRGALPHPVITAARIRVVKIIAFFIINSPLSALKFFVHPEGLFPSADIILPHSAPEYNR